MKSAKRKFRPDGNWSQRTSEKVDNLVGMFSPKRAYLRKAYRFSYDAIDGTRLRKKRSLTYGTGDTHLTERNLFKLREINRELTRNNPLIEGMFETARDGIIGFGTTIQARTGDDKLNAELEAIWKEEMIDQACDITGRLNFNIYLGAKFLSYIRDGDCATIFGDDWLQPIEGEQIGTPYGQASPEHYEIINGVAFSKQTKAVIGYYIGESDRKFGYIKPGSWRKYRPEFVHHMFNPRRFSQSRGLPALTSAIDFIDKLNGYVDAELVRAKVNACFAAFIARKDGNEDMMPPVHTEGSSSSGRDEENYRLEKLEPGTIMYGEPGESISGVGMGQSGSIFDPFILRVLTMIGRPMCLPLMLITLDFAGATFMNARIAYQKVQDAWMREQDWVVKPFVSRVWRWKMGRMLENGRISVHNKDLQKAVLRHEIFCKRWPYVNPYQESKADEQQLKNGTTTRQAICARQGDDYTDVVARLAIEEAERKEKGLFVEPKQQKGF